MCHSFPVFFNVPLAIHYIIQSIRVVTLQVSSQTQAYIQTLPFLVKNVFNASSQFKTDLAYCRTPYPVSIYYKRNVTPCCYVLVVTYRRGEHCLSPFFDLHTITQKIWRQTAYIMTPSSTYVHKLSVTPLKLRRLFVGSRTLTSIGQPRYQRLDWGAGISGIGLQVSAMSRVTLSPVLRLQPITRRIFRFVLTTDQVLTYVVQVG